MVASASAVHQDGNLRMRQHLLRDAAEKKSLESSPPVRCHENDVALAPARGVQDALVGRRGARHQRLEALVRNFETPAAGGESVLYVWGVDRGAGTERFLATGSPPIGDGVAFDSVVILRPDGTATVNLFGLGGGATNLPASTALISGNTISAFLDEMLLPTQGKDFSDYTWNLWPRFGGGQNAQISDFAPNEASGAIDAANARVTVPEPSSLALLGIGALAFVRRRQKR